MKIDNRKTLNAAKKAVREGKVYDVQTAEKFFKSIADKQEHTHVGVEDNSCWIGFPKSAVEIDFKHPKWVNVIWEANNKERVTKILKAN